MKIIYCGTEYSDQILEIFNDAVRNSTAIYDYDTWSDATMQQWFEIKKKGNFPVIGIIDESTNELLGFGTYGHFRYRQAYKYTIEISLYVHKNHRGKGLGKILMNEIIRNASEQKYHCLVGVIDSNNDVSIGLHKQFGFVHSGTIRETGYKFNRWLNIDIYQLLLPYPENPVDG
jgi:phosphinothricin acetyltransferase